VTRELEDGTLISDSNWDDEGPDTLADVLNQLGTSDPQAVKALTQKPQWGDFSLALRHEVEQWLADQG
jgi:hypothetical protein